MMKKALLVLFLLLLTCSACESITGLPEVPVLGDTDVVLFAFDDVISEYGDIELGPDGYYHFALNKEEGQVVRHIYANIYRNRERFQNAVQALHGATVQWQSNLEWALSDSVMYIVRRRCPYNDDDTWCVMNMEQWVPSDTVVIDYFGGMIVPTINASSYPSGSEVSTVIAPLVAMAGDTMIINVKANFEGRVIASAIGIILE